MSESGAAELVGSNPRPVDEPGRTENVRRVLAGIFDVADPASAASRSVSLIVWGLWCALALLLLFSHEPWRDELQAWGLVRASSTPLDVIFNLRHEGHPPTWYLLLWPFTQTIGSYVGLKVVTFMVGASATWIVLRAMPVSLWMRTAVVFTYFPLFEFGAISRSYSLAWLLTVAALWLANRPGTANWLLAVVLGALAGTTVLGIPLAIAMAIAIWGGPWFASRTRGPMNLPWLSLFTVVPAVIVAVTLPATGNGPSISMSRLTLSSLWNASASTLRAAFPVMESEDAFWGVFVVRNWTTWGPLLGAALILAITWSVRRSRTALTVWLVSTIGYLVMLVVTGVPMSPRLVSPLWCSAIAAVWFAAVDRRAVPPATRRPLSVVTMASIAFLIGASLWASSWAVRVDASIPFTTAAAAAEWIDQQSGGTDVVILCAIPAPQCSSVSIRLDVPAYTTADGEPIEYVKWTPGWGKTLKAESIFGAAAALGRRTGAEVFVVAPTAGYPRGCEYGLRPPPRAVTEWVLVCRADQLWGPPAS